MATLISNSTVSTDYVWYGTENSIYDITLSITNSNNKPFGYDVVSVTNGVMTVLATQPLTVINATTTTLSFNNVVGRIGFRFSNPQNNTLSASITSINADPSNNSALVQRTLYNYTPVTLAAGTATDIIAANTTIGFKTVPALAGKLIKFALNYNVYCPTASTTWALTLKLGNTTLYSGSATGQQMVRKLEFILDQTNNYIYVQRNTLVDNAAAVLVTKVAFSGWNTPQLLSLTVNPTAAAMLIGLEAGYAE